METNIKNRWESICNEYLILFCNKHEIDIEYELNHGGVWVGDHVGTIADIADMFVHMNEIRYDIDNNIPKEQFSKWYWTSINRAGLGIKYMNYESFCKGLRDPISQEQLEKIKESKKRVEEAQRIFEESIKEYKDINFK